jgi:hypothetical protein
VPAKRSTDCQTIDILQQQINDNGIWRVYLGLFDDFRAAASDVYIAVGILQQALDHDFGQIFENEDDRAVHDTTNFTIS